MSLKVKVCNCKSLPDIETIGVIDPFVVLTFRGQPLALYSARLLQLIIIFEIIGIQKKTGTADNTVNPTWENEVSRLRTITCASLVVFAFLYIYILLS